MIYTAYSHEYLAWEHMHELAEKVKKGILNHIEETILTGWALRENPNLDPRTLKTKIFNGCFFVYN